MRPPFYKTFGRKLDKLRRIDFSKNKWEDIFLPNYIELSEHLLLLFDSFHSYDMWFITHTQPQDFAIILGCLPEKVFKFEQVLGSSHLPLISESLKRKPIIFVRLVTYSDDVCRWACQIICEGTFTNREHWWEQVKQIANLRHLTLPIDVYELMKKPYRVMGFNGYQLTT